MQRCHIYADPLQAVAATGEPVQVLGSKDTFPVPIAGSVIDQTRFLDFIGTRVYHCHPFGHEGGMAGIIELVPQQPCDESAALPLTGDGPLAIRSVTIE